MKSRIVGLLVFVALANCKTISGPVPPPGTPGVVNCLDTAVHNAALGFLPAVENALATDNWEAALATIVAQDGGPLALAAVECAVAWIVSKAETNTAMASVDPLEVTKEAHGKAWLSKQGVQFATPVGP